MNPEQLEYAGFWKRFGSFWIDTLVILPLSGLAFWTGEYSRLIAFYYAIPFILFYLWYHVYLVQRYGGTPGKLLMGLRIAKVDGTAVDWKAAFLRYSVSLFLGFLSSTAICIALLKITDDQFLSAAMFHRYGQLSKYVPSWNDAVETASQIWIWSEFVVMLLNKERRALHDFIGGTVVVVFKKKEDRAISLETTTSVSSL